MKVTQHRVLPVALSLLLLLAYSRAEAQFQQIRGWGDNSNGQLGNGTMIDSNIPVKTVGLLGVVSVGGGGDHSLAVKMNGTVWAWGSNSNGQLGNGTTNDSSSPVQVSVLTNILQATGGTLHSLAVRSNGTVWTWGSNSNGQLGNGTTHENHLPVRISGLTNVVQVSGGDVHSLAVKSDGTVWTWGGNNSGQLGNGTFNNSKIPVQVIGLTNVAQVAGSESSSIALKSDGTVWAWGNNQYGQIGNGTTTDSATPVLVSGITGVIQIIGAANHSLAVKSDGTVWAWGLNDTGQLGDGTNIERDVPVQVLGLSSVTHIAGGANFSFALKSDGKTWGWGRNTLGQLGNGANTDTNTPILISNLLNTVQIAGGAKHSIAICTSPRLDGVDVTGNYGQMVTLTARLRSRPSGDPIVGAVVSFSIDGIFVGSTVTDLKGFARAGYKATDNLAIGDHALVASFGGDANNLDTVATSVFTTLQTGTTLSSANLSVQAGDGLSLRVRLKSAINLDGVPGQSITFKVDGVFLGTATTDVNGIATFPYAVPQLSVGAHTVDTAFIGTAQYSGSASSGVMMSSTSNTQLATDEITGAVGTTINLTAILKRATDGGYLLGRTVTFRVDGVVVGSVQTSVSGLASFSYTLNLTAGKHKITTSFAGDADYNSSNGGSDLITY